MYISKIKINNYRGFDDIEVEFKNGLNVIIGHNNGGKSSLLSALAIVLDVNTQKHLSAWDFYQGLDLNRLKNDAPSIKISVFLSMADGEDIQSYDAALFSSYATALEPKLEACLNYRFHLPLTESEDYKEEVKEAESVKDIFKIIDNKFIRKYTYDIYGGVETSSQKVAAEDLRKIDFQSVNALRDVEHDLFSGRAELLHEVLNYFLDYDIRNSKKSVDEIRNEIAQKHKDFQEKTSQNIAELISRIQDGQNTILNYANETGAMYNNRDLNFDGAMTEEQLLKVLELFVKTSSGFNLPIANNGLGYNNLIYISLLLAKMQSHTEVSLMGTTNAKVFSVLSIEEPEAHLHPELQYHFLEFLNNNLKNNRVKQIFVTSHSPSLTAKVNLNDLCCLFKKDNKVSAHYPRNIYDKDSDAQKFVQRYLDATRADMLFAGRIIFVEGLAEQILIPVFATLLGLRKKWYQKQVIVINLGGRYFDKFLKMYDTQENSNAIPLKVACITDRDPVRKRKQSTSNKKNQYERCWPIEYETGTEQFEYRNHSADFVTEYQNHINIRYFSQDEKGKTLEYEIARCNANNTKILTESIRNKDELEKMMAPGKLENLKSICTNDDLVKIHTESQAQWEEEDVKKALIAARYLESVKKGENALELANTLLELDESERESFIVPPYIEEALRWLLQD